jgi:AP endonuclease-1
MRDERMKDLPMVLETVTEEVWPKEIDILQRMADLTVPEDQLDFEGMAEEIRVEVKKYEKEPVKKEPKKKKEPAAGKKGTAAKGKKGKKAESEEGAGDSEED